MHIQNKYSWIKHVDFMALNLIALIVSFIASFYAKFGSLSLMLTSTWEGLLAILCLINIIATLGMNPYSGILRRPYHADAIKLFNVRERQLLAVIDLKDLDDVIESIGGRDIKEYNNSRILLS